MSCVHSPEYIGSRRSVSRACWLVVSFGSGGSPVRLRGPPHVHSAAITYQALFLALGRPGPRGADAKGGRQMVREVSTCVAAQGVLRNDQAGQAAGGLQRSPDILTVGPGGFP